MTHEEALGIRKLLTAWPELWGVFHLSARGLAGALMSVNT